MHTTASSLWGLVHSWSLCLRRVLTALSHTWTILEVSPCTFPRRNARWAVCREETMSPLKDCDICSGSGRSVCIALPHALSKGPPRTDTGLPLEILAPVACSKWWKGPLPLAKNSGLQVVFVRMWTVFHFAVYFTHTHLFIHVISYIFVYSLYNYKCILSVFLKNYIIIVIFVFLIILGLHISINKWFNFR